MPVKVTDIEYRLFFLLVSVISLQLFSLTCVANALETTTRTIGSSSNQTIQSNEYWLVHPEEEQCLFKPFNDPQKMEWKLNCTHPNNATTTCHGINIKVHKMAPSFCFAIQLFSEKDHSLFVQVNKTDNFQKNMNERVMPDNVRYRVFCYFQHMGSFDFEDPPISFCLTRLGQNHSTDCTVGYANENLDALIASSRWNCNQRKLFQQFLMHMTTLNIEIPLTQSDLNSGLQMHVMMMDYYQYPKDFSLKYLENPYYIIPLVVNHSIETSPHWDNQCTEYSYNVRPQYYIWKMMSLVFGTIEYGAIFFFLIIKRKHRIIESRFIIPIFSVILYLVRCLVNIGLNIAYYDPDWDYFVEQIAIIIVMSLQLLQGIRYYLIRLFYSRYYSKRNGFFLKFLLSRIYFLIAIVFVVLSETSIVTLLLFYGPKEDLSTFYSAITISCCVSYFILLGIGITMHFIANISFVKKIKHPKQVLKWFFLHDDPFGYNGEFLVLACILLLAGVHFGLATISGTFLSNSTFASTRPISLLYLNNGFGYFLYGFSKILLTLAYGFQHIYLIALTYTTIEKPKSDLKEQKEELDLFLSKVFNDGTACVEILKRFLVSEFKLELLEIYLFLSTHPKSTLNDHLKTNPQNAIFIYEYFNKNSHNHDSYQEVTLLLLDSFNRLKHTVVYEEEYLRRATEEIQFVFDSIK